MLVQIDFCAIEQAKLRDVPSLLKPVDTPRGVGDQGKEGLAPYALRAYEGELVRFAS